MKTYVLSLGLFISVSCFGQQLFIKSYSNIQELESLYTSQTVSLKHVGKDFIIATSLNDLPAGSIQLKKDPWAAGANFFLVWLPVMNCQNALKQLRDQFHLLYTDDSKAIVETRFSSQPGPTPYIHGGVIRISPASSWKHDAIRNSLYVIDTFPAIFDMMALVDTGEFMPTIRHLQDYGTRYCITPEAVEAQNWIREKFEEYPQLSVELQNFPYWSGSSSDNVIATLPGKLTPDQYIVVGAHYDSYSWGSSAPGADDNASGTAAVLEAARILSQFEFDRSIVFCTFSAEEVGLVGSEYYASNAQAQGMDILGYFNFDMIGYRNGLDPIHTDMIAPVSATELVDFYKGVVAIYLPEFDVYDAQLSGGDSDHTSFNNNGYMGIFPFEDVPNYSPYIHTGLDLVGPSVNSPEMAKTFIQANLASLVSLSVPYNPVGVPDNSPKAKALLIFPNPVQSKVNLLPLTKDPLTVTIYTSLGQQVLETTITEQTSVDVISLVPGIYIVEVISPNGTEFERLVVAPR